MPLSLSEKKERLEWLAGVVSDCSRIVLQYYAEDLHIDWKNGTEPVTEADRASNTFLVENIAAQFPEEGILAEESVEDRSQLSIERVWMIDPIDGTKEFIKHNGEFSIMVGLVEKGQPVLGVVLQPTENKLFMGAKGVTAQMLQNDVSVKLKVSQQREIPLMRLATSRSHREPVLDDIQARLCITEAMEYGSVGLKCGMIAYGNFDLYIHTTQHSRLWDSCAPQAILEAAGGTMTDLFGLPLNYKNENLCNAKGLLASNGTMHEKIASLIAEIFQK